ncbi:MAG: hypothetical protein OHK0046_24120 [Anaerolineae bacterium]
MRVKKMAEPKRLTAHAEKLLNGLDKHRNQWLTRLEIARVIGKKRLTPYDIALLELLAEQNVIKMAQEEGFSREGYRWVYGVFDREEQT